MGLVLGLSLRFSLSRVEAQTWGLSFWPPLLEVTIQPGKSLTQAYWLINQGGRDLYLTAVVVPFRPEGDQGQLRPLTLELDPEVKKLFRLTNSQIQLGQSFKLAANSRQQLVLKITPPATQPEGDYYYLFLIKQAEEGEFLPASGGQSLIQIGSPILITVTRSAQPLKQAAISQFRAQPRWAKRWQQPIQFQLRVKNIGPHFFKPEGEITILYWGRWPKATLTLRPDNILADSQRLIGCLKEDRPQPCQFWSWWPGYYQARVEFRPDGQAESLQVTTDFFLLPLEPFLGLILILGLIKIRPRPLKLNLTKIGLKLNNN